MPRHPKWGRPIKEYFFQDIPGSFFPDGPVTEACAPFSRTLSLLRYPDKLRTIDNTMSLSNTVKALQNSDYTGGYASQANQASGITILLFSYEYGFLAFRCIILFMQAGILAHTNSFSLFERRAKDLSDPHAISVALSNFVMEIMYESLEKPNPRDWLLGILTSQRGGRMFLRTVGGFYDDDVDILLRALWDDRKNFLSIITKAPGLIPGWGLPLMLIGEHLMWAKEYQIEKGDEWSMLQALCFRYSVVAPDPELKMMTANCIRAEFYGYPTTPEDDPGANEFHQKSIVDVDDARTFLVNYIHRAVKPKMMVLPSELAIQLVGFARQDAILDIIYWMPSLLEISCLWTWRFVGWLPDMTTGSVSAVYLVIHATRVLDLIGRLFSKHVAAPSKTISTFVKALARQDIVELCGRLLMFPLTMGSNITQIAEEHPETFNRVIDPTKPFFVPYVWSLLVHRVTSVATSYSMSGRPSNGILSPQYEQWLKVWRCFEADFPQHDSSTESFLAYKRSASAAWLSLGSSFSFADRRARTKMECSNPRCPGVGLEHASPLTCEHCPSAVYCSNWCQSLLVTEARYLKKYLLLAEASRMDRNYNSPMHPYNFLWNEDEGTDRPGFYPFVFGIDGMGEIHANDPDPLVTLAPPHPPPDTTLGEKPPSASDQLTLSSQPGVVSYALPTPNIPLSLRVGTLTVVAPGPVLSMSATISPTSLASTSVIQTPVQAAATTSTLESPLVAMSMPLTSLVISSLASSAISVSSPNASEAVLTSAIVPVPSSPAVSPPGEPSKHKHELVFYIALALIVLILLGTICTSLSWIMRRRRKQRAQAENELWIGQVLRDEPDVHSIDIKQDHGDFELEKGNVEYVGPGAAGIGTGHRGATHYRGEDFGLGVPPRGYGLSNEFNTQGFANIQPSRRYPSLLQRGAPTAAEYPHHGLDHGGLTFRHDPSGRLTFQPTRANLDDISTPNPYEHPAYPNPHDDPSVRRPAPVMATQSGAASHYSYGGAGPLAVTNLMPGDISSRTSEVSLGKMTGRLAVDNGGPARSLGLPTGRLDNPNPWRRYDGVENRGGVMGMDPYGETETKGWGATIRSGIYSAVGRLVGAPGEDPEGEKRSDRDKDRFTEIVKRRRLPRDSEGTPSEYEIKLGHQDHDRPDDPDGPKVPAGETSQSRSPSEKHEYQANWREISEERWVRNMVPDSRGWIIEEDPTDGSRGKVHIGSGARDRILRRLGSTSTRMSSTTAYSTDVDAVFTSAATTRANTIATSRRDTMSTRWSGCRRRENSRTGEMRAQERALSSTSSDWGTLSMAKALGMELGGPASRSHGPL